MTRPLSVLLAVVLLAGVQLAPVPAAAQTYRWTDESGAVHYSQGIESVPPRYRGGAVVVSPASPLPSPAAPSGAQSAPSQVSPAGSSGPASGVARIPYTPGQPIVVTARINDSGTARLILDTGAQGTVISPDVLASLGISFRDAVRGSIKGVTGDASVLAVKVDRIEVEGARFGPLMVMSHDSGVGPGMDGLLGRDFLDNFTVTIDSSARVVTLTPKK